MKKFFSILIVAMLATSYANAATTRIYCKMEYNWWTKDGARIGVILDGGATTAMTLVTGSATTWYADVDLSGKTNIVFQRIGSSNTASWGAQTTEQNISSNGVGTTKNMFTITNSSDTWSGSGNYCTGTWGTYVAEAYVTFTSGTTIYYDLTGYGSGVNDLNDTWHASTTEMFSVTLSSDWNVTASTKLFRSAASGWGNVTCSTLPAEGQNMIVSSDGATAHWDTYVPPTTPSVAFVNLGTSIPLNADVQFSAISNNINGVGQPATSYKYYVQAPGGSMALLATDHYQFASAGSYTVRVRAYDSSNTQKAQLEKTVTVADANKVYFVDNNSWAAPYVYLYNPENTGWPGLEMTRLVTTTEQNNYPVYAAAFSTASTTAIFSNNGESQLADKVIEAAKPYYFNGAWYASLAECDPAAPELETYHIYVDDRTEWERFQLYAWGDREAFGGWPGATTNTTQVVDGVTYKVFTYQAEEGADITLNLIFNNKVGDEGEQLADYTITKAADYYLVATASGVAANNQVNLMGSFNNWTNVDAMTIAPNGLTASCTRLLTKGTHGFKITLGATWKAAAETTAITRDNSATGVTFSEDEGDNTSIVADMTGNYTFTYTYATKKLTVTYPNDPVVYTPALTLKGAFDSWGDGAAFADNGTTASLTRHFEAGQHEFKVIVGDYWKSNAVPFTRGNNVRLFYEDTDNAVLVADMAGDYTFTYDYEEQTIAVSYPAAMTTTLYFVNSDSWSPVQAYVYWYDGDNDLSDSPHVWPGNAMTLTGEDAYGFDVYSYTFAGVYTSVIFNNKVGDEGEQIDDQVWNAATPYFYNGTWYASLDDVKAAMVLSLSETADNNAAIAAADGQTLPIEIRRSFAANVLYTLCLPFDVSASDLAVILKCDTLFVLSDAENNGSELLIYFDKANTIEAGKPYLYVPAENVTNPTFVATIDASASQTLTAGDVTMTGFYAPMAMPDGNNFVLGNDRLLHKTTSSAVITNAFRAYFTISGSVPAHIPARVVWRDQQTDTATSLDNATSGSQTIKVIRNGQLLIIRDGKAVNMLGAELR